MELKTTQIVKKVDFKDTIVYKEDFKNTHINIGTGEDISIKDLAFLIKKEVGFKGYFIFNTDKPDGTIRKVTDVSKLHELNWKHTIGLEKGVGLLYNWYLKQ